jgi:hypothetical protein
MSDAPQNISGHEMTLGASELWPLSCQLLKSCITFNNNKLSNSQNVIMHKITEFYT